MTITRDIHDNWYVPVSFKKFQSLSEVFLKKAKKEFNTKELDVSVTLYSDYRNKLTPLDYEDFQAAAEYKRGYDQSITIVKTNDISKITKEAFESAASICIAVVPNPPIENRPHAFGLATFKDQSDKRVSFIFR